MMRHSKLSLLLIAGFIIAAPAQAQRHKAAAKKTAVTKEKKTAKKGVPAPATKVAPKPVVISRQPGNDTTLKSTTLEVYQVYKPEIKPAPKPELTPGMPPAETQRLQQQYDVPQQTLYYTYRSLPLRPLALGKDTATPPFANYIKAGGGNLSGIYADIGIGNLKGENWETAIHASHISQSGDIAGQKYGHTELDATGTLHAGDHAWTAAIDADYRRAGLYGYDHSAFKYEDDQIRRRYFGAGLSLGVKNEKEGIWGIDYAPSVRAAFFSGTSINQERTIELHAPFSKKLDEHLTVALGAHGLFTRLSTDTLAQGNNIFWLTPSLNIRKDRFTAHLGLNPTFGKNSNAYLLPDITAAWQIRDRFGISAGWQASLVQNTYQQLWLCNPFYDGVQQVQQTRNDEVFAGFTTGIGRHFSLEARGSWWQYNHLPVYVLPAAAIDAKSFTASYIQKVNALSLQVSARYQLANTFSIGISGAWYNYDIPDGSRLWHEPAVRLKGDFQWQLLKDLRINAYFSVADEIYARNTSGVEIKLKGVSDIGLGAEYQLIPRLSLWLNTGNLFNRYNERWLGYQGFGFNIMGGIRFKF